MMNAPIIDPLQGDFPEIIEEYLQHGNTKCVAFNRRGTLLAAGCSDGGCVIWDFETRGIAKELRDADCSAPITSVCWSKYGHRLLASATDRSLTLWNVESGEKITRITLHQAALRVHLFPRTCSPSLCLACPLSTAPVLVDLNSGSSTVLPVSVSDVSNGHGSYVRAKFADGSPPFTPTAATFNKSGDLIYVGNSKGEILIVDTKTIQVHAVMPISGGFVVKDIVFSRNGQYLLTDSNDRVIRVYENLLPVKNSGKVLEQLRDDGSNSELKGYEKLKDNGSRCLRLSCELVDAVTRLQWKVPCFSGDGEWIISASASKGEHKLYIWDRAGHLVKILEGPREALIDLEWHPVRPIIVSVSVTGIVYIWAKDHVENWSAFAPDFRELEENEEYVEREDEFDINPDVEAVEDSEVNEDVDVDIDGLEGGSDFSNSDASMEELLYLPSVPVPDIPEEDQDKCPGSSKVEDSNHSGSPFSTDAVQNSAIPAALSPPEAVANSAAEEGFVGGSLKRKRKPSAKGLELQVADSSRKPKVKNGKASKSKAKQIEASEDDEATEDDM